MCKSFLSIEPIKEKCLNTDTISNGLDHYNAEMMMHKPKSIKKGYFWLWSLALYHSMSDLFHGQWYIYQNIVKCAGNSTLYVLNITQLNTLEALL